MLAAYALTLWGAPGRPALALARQVIAAGGAAGAVLNAINTRLDAEGIAFILKHGEAKVLIVDPEFSEVVERAVRIAHAPDLLVVDIVDSSFPGGQRIGRLTYDELLAEGDPAFDWLMR